MVLTAHKVINCWSFKEYLFCPTNDIQKTRVIKILTDFFLITITKNVATFDPRGSKNVCTYSKGTSSTSSYNILDTRVSKNGVFKNHIFLDEHHE